MSCPVPRGRVVLYEHGRRLHARARRFRLATEFAHYRDDVHARLTGLRQFARWRHVANDLRG
jgi:hypothetical protein